jgi:hypothetical protein
MNAVSVVSGKFGKKTALSLRPNPTGSNLTDLALPRLANGKACWLLR